jgi:hypothetical protein
MKKRPTTTRRPSRQSRGEAIYDGKPSPALPDVNSSGEVTTTL